MRTTKKKNTSNYNRQIEKELKPKVVKVDPNTYKITANIYMTSFEKMKEISKLPKFEYRYQRVLRKVLELALNNPEILKELTK